MVILSLDDFKDGKYSIPDSTGVYTDSEVQEAIDNYEKPAIRKLLGVTLGNLIITYKETTPAPPANADYDKIINPFSYQANNDSCSSILESLGMKHYLKASVFYEYAHNGLKLSQAGVTKAKAETSDVVSAAAAMRFAEKKFNDALDTIDAIQQYCRISTDKYPDFAGERIAVKASQYFL